MSNDVTTIVYSGNPNFDGLLSGTQWASTNLTFSFPTDSADYNFGYIAGAGAPSDDFAPLNRRQSSRRRLPSLTTMPP